MSDPEDWQGDMVIIDGKAELANFRRLSEPRGMPTTAVELALLMGASVPSVFWNAEEGGSGTLDVASCYAYTGLDAIAFDEERREWASALWGLLDSISEWMHRS